MLIVAGKGVRLQICESQQLKVPTPSVTGRLSPEGYFTVVQDVDGYWDGTTWDVSNHVHDFAPSSVVDSRK